MAKIKCIKCFTRTYGSDCEKAVRCRRLENENLLLRAENDRLKRELADIAKASAVINGRNYAKRK